MRRIWDSIVAILVTAFAVYLLFQMIRPFVFFIVIAILLFFFGNHAYNRSRRG